MSTIEHLLRNNAAYVARFDRGDLPAEPQKRLAVLTCMDARIDPHRMLGLDEGDAHVIRNAGGVASDDAIRSLAVSQRLLGTCEIVVILHTDCGMRRFSENDFSRQLHEQTGVKPNWQTTEFSTLEDDVRQTVSRIVESPFILHNDHVRGFVYQVESGQLREVVS
jgi:carbonic anhydrase